MTLAGLVVWHSTVGGQNFSVASDSFTWVGVGEVQLTGETVSPLPLPPLTTVHACQNYQTIGVTNADSANRELDTKRQVCSSICSKTKLVCSNLLLIMISSMIQQPSSERNSLKIRDQKPICAHMQEIFQMSGDKNRKQQQGLIRGSPSQASLSIYTYLKLV